MQQITLTSLVAAVALTGCTTYTPQRYAISADNQSSLRQQTQIQAEVGVGAIQPPQQFNPWCRAAGPIAPPDGLTYEDYIRKALQDELKQAHKWAPPGQHRVELTGQIDRLAFGSVHQLLNQGYWEIGLTVHSSNGQTARVVERYVFPSGFDALSACLQTASALVPAVQNLIGQLVGSNDFVRLTQPVSQPSEKRSATRAATAPGPATN